MGDLFDQPDDATPLTPEEQRELIPAHIAYRSELNEAEQENIARAQDWALKSRRDLLTVFLRPDEEIAADVCGVLEEILRAGPEEAEVAVRDGVVTLTGTLDPQAGAHGDLIPVAIRLMWDVDGVVDVIDRLGQPSPATQPPVTQPAGAPPAQAS